MANGIEEVVEDQQASRELRVEDGATVKKRGRVLLLIAIILLILLLLAACALLANILTPQPSGGERQNAGIIWIRSIYGFGPTQADLITPTSCFANPDGSGFWITDEVSRRVVEFDWNGAFRQVFYGEGSSEVNFQNPSSIAIAPDGWMYVAQQTYNGVSVFDQNHNYVKFIQIPTPFSLDVNSDRLVVGSVEGFVVFDRDGNPLWFHGGQDDPDHQFDTVSGVVIDRDNNIFVLDTYNNRLVKYDPTGKLLFEVKMGPAGNDPTLSPTTMNLEEQQALYPSFLQIPVGITLDNAGRVIVIDVFDFSVAAFNANDGTFIDKWGVYGHEDGKFFYPGDISYDRGRDWFVVADTGNNRVQIIKIPGSGGNVLQAARAGLTGPLGACLLPFLLIILAIILYTLWRYLQNRRDKMLHDRDVDFAEQSMLENGEIIGEDRADVT